MKWLALLAAMFVGLMVAYSIFYPTTTYKFRITLNVDTPQGLKSGSSVMEVRHRRYPAWTTLGNNTGKSSLVGQAVFVDLGRESNGQSKNLLALLAMGRRGDDPDLYLLPSMVFEHLWKQKRNAGSPSEEVPKLPPGTKANLYGDRILALLTFSNLNDPKTARAVQPDSVAKAFGGGFSLQSVVIEIVPVSEPVTRGLKNRLPWWDGPNRPAEVALRAANLVPNEPELAFIRD